MVEIIYHDMEITIGIPIHRIASFPFIGKGRFLIVFKNGRISPGINTDPIA